MTTNRYFTRKRLLALALVALPGVTLATAPYLPRLIEEGYPAPRWPGTGLPFAVIEGAAAPDTLPAATEGMKAPSDWARQLMTQSDGKALLVHHRGRLHLEHYAEDTDDKTRFNSYSMAKSLIGALVLKALAEERIATLDEPIGRYLPELPDEAVRDTSILAFLEMRSGLAFESGGKKEAANMPQKLVRTETYNPFGKLARLHMQGVDAVADDLHIDPRRTGQFDYQNVNTALLGQLLERLYEQPLERLLSEKIWHPAGAATAAWRRYDESLPVSPYCCIYATARDWLRIGVFFARNGDGKAPFLPQDLWRKLFGAEFSTEKLASNHYGTHIYHNVLDRPGEALQGRFTFMFGSRGQTVYMLPEEDLVVVRFGEKIPLLHSTLYSAYRSVSQTSPSSD